MGFEPTTLNFEVAPGPPASAGERRISEGKRSIPPASAGQRCYSFRYTIPATHHEAARGAVALRHVVTFCLGTPALWA
jgi:hypothetical protein